MSLRRLCRGAGHGGRIPSLLHEHAGVSQLVDNLPCKQDVAGSSPASGSNAGVAQKEEHFRGKEEVAGSNPATSSILLKVWLPA